MNKITNENLLTRSELSTKPGDYKIKYVRDILGLEEDNIIYCKVIKEPKGQKIIVNPYNLKNGMRKDIFKNQDGGWKLGLKEETNLKLHLNDFIRANIQVIHNELCINNIEKMDSFDEFREKLVTLLKPKWQREGFKFECGEIVTYDGSTAFNEWVSSKVEVMLEEKYKAFIEKKMLEEEEKLNKQKKYIENLQKEQEEERRKLYDLEKKHNQVKEELDNIINERNKVKEELDSIIGEKYKKQIILNKLIDKQKKRQKWANRKQKELDSIINERNQAQEELDGLRNEKKTMLNNFIKRQRGAKEVEYYQYDTFENLIDEVWTYVQQNKHLYYEKSIIKYFMNALRTKQLIILWGNPGTGKTSLPRAVAHAINAKFIRVQVQSNWTDNQDLLGFYNIVDKRYVSTQFMDALIDASENTEQMYIILLDEMNLSKIEYYFSEMLNVFTWDEPYILQLYSKHLVEDYLNLAKESKEDVNINAVLRDMAIYKPEFTVPENVRFVGTLNVDETTKTISPKVIDRSCLIELNTISNRKKYIEKDIMLDGEKMVKFEKFAIHKTQFTEESQNLKIKKNIRELFDETKITISNRVDFYIDQWTSQKDNCVTLDEIVLEKILPIIDMEDNDTNRKILKELQKNLIKYKCTDSAHKLETMLENKQTYIKRIRYWEN